jgi:hypothetical protein
MSNEAKSVRRAFRQRLVVPLSLVSLIIVGGCDDEPSEDAVYTVAAVFIDLTEIEERGGETRLKDSAYLKALADLVISRSEEGDTQDGGEISFFTLSNESISTGSFRQEIGLGNANQNPMIRTSDVERFRDSTVAGASEFIEEIIAKAMESNFGESEYQRSHILRPICRYLRGEANKKYENVPQANQDLIEHKLVIFSDMLENSPVYSFFSSPTINRGEATQAFLDECVGITAPPRAEYRILQQPLGRTDPVLDERRNNAETEWRVFFEQIGLDENQDLGAPQG